MRVKQYNKTNEIGIRSERFMTGFLFILISIHLWKSFFLNIYIQNYGIIVASSSKNVKPSSEYVYGF